MLFATLGQWRVFLAMMVAGLLVGCAYDLLAAARRLLRAGTLLSLCADLAFGLLAALILGGMLTLRQLRSGASLRLSRRGGGRHALRPRAAPPRARASARFCAQISTNMAAYRQISSN